MLKGVRREFKTEDGSVWLMEGDAKLILPQIAEPVDCIVADIPYGEVNRESGGLRNLNKQEADIETFPLSFVIEQSARLAASVYIWCGIEQVSELRAGFVSSGMTTRLGGWEKSNPSPMNGEKFWLSSFECCVFARKSNAYFSEHCASPIWRGPIQRDQIHPTQKPLWLIETLVKASTPIGGTCLDFCFGSATTLIAARRFGMRAIGIELDGGHFDTGVNRIQSELSRTALLEPVAKVTQRSLLEEP